MDECVVEEEGAEKMQDQRILSQSRRPRRDPLIRLPLSRSRFRRRHWSFPRSAPPPNSYVLHLSSFILQNHHSHALLFLFLRPVKSSIVDKESTRAVVSLLLDAEAAVDGDEKSAAAPHAGSSSSSIRVIDAFLVPQLRYDSIKKLFYEHSGSLPIHGNVSAKAALYRDRFLLLFQRLSRDQHFSKPAFDSEMSHFGNCEIYPIQSLVGQTGRRWVMGLISQLEDGHFYLEDLAASVEINLSNAITTGFFAENTIVVAEGEMLAEAIFQVISCGFPPLEDREKSIKLLAGHDFFGSSVLTKEETLRLAELESKAVNDMFVIISDMWLDNEEAMGKLTTDLDVFENEEVVPSMFVFMGNFSSRSCNLSFPSFSSLRSQFGKLGHMIGMHQQPKENSRFLFILGPDDQAFFLLKLSGPSKVLPRCALPKYLIEVLQNHIPNAIFSSNPCRIKFLLQEIVFFREDLLYRMHRSCLMRPCIEETEDSFEHLVATITHQSHLYPLPLVVQPIIWNYDHALYLYPTPHTIVLGDRSNQ